MADTAPSQPPDAPPEPSTGSENSWSVAVDITGRTLGDFQILRKIGSGGMGQVYLARQLSLKRNVAVKLLRNDLAANPNALKRFETEAHAVARLNHPNIVQVYHLGECDGLRYMVLEYVDGRNLRDFLARKGPPDLPVTLSIIKQVALALQKAHEQGIVHRDIKPENILLTRKVEVKVTDFGLSRFFRNEEPEQHLTQSGVTLGTPLYMSPEQVQGQPIDHRSDIYSLGVSCYHLLAGEPPFRGKTAFDVAMKHVHETPRPLTEFRPDLPADLCAMVHKMMAKDPAQRYQSAKEILRDLHRVREGLGLLVTMPSGASSVGATPSGGSALNLSGTGETTLPTASTPQGMPSRVLAWGSRGLVLAGAIALALVAGAWLYEQLHPSASAHLPRTDGLIEIPPPLPPTTTRERELVKVLESRDTAPQDVIAAAVELGLLYLREYRLKEAEARFEKLEKENFRGKLSDHAQLAGRLGRAIVLAFQDRPTDSNNLFMAVVPKINPKASIPPKFREFREFLLANPALSQAISEALERNATNLRVQTLAPPLETLRQARDLTRPMKD